jgi:hypothetical protein
MAFVQSIVRTLLLNLYTGFMIDAQRSCRTGVSGSDSCVRNMESFALETS